MRVKPHASLLFALIGFAVPDSILAQRPEITSITTELSSDRFTPGMTVKIGYRPATEADVRHFPGHNETVFVRVAGQKVLVLGAGNGVATAVLPQEMALGSASITIATSGGESEAQKIEVRAFAPGLYEPEPYCSASTTGPSMQLGARLLAVGLGPVDRQGRTVNQPRVTVSGQAAEVLDSVLIGGGTGSIR